MLPAGLTVLISVLMASNGAAGNAKLDEELDPTAVRLLLSNDFESGSMEPWYDESPGETHWVLENLESPQEPTPVPTPASGGSYVRVDRPEGYTSGLAVLYTPFWTANPGDKLSLSFWIRSRHTQGNSLDVYWINGTREEKLLALSSFSSSSNNQWRTAEATIPVSQSTNTKLVIYGYCGPNEEDSIAIDNIILEPGTQSTTTSTTSISTLETTTKIVTSTTFNPNACHYELNDGSGQFASPTINGNYLNNLACSWLITVPSSNYQRVQLSFTSFFTEAGYDKARVYDGPTSSDRLLLDHSGNGIPPVVDSSSTSMLVTFTTDSSNVYPGFSAVFQGIGSFSTIGKPTANTTPRPGCSYELSGSTTGTLNSPNYPNLYPVDLDCRWLITVPSSSNTTADHVIQLNFDHFQTEFCCDRVLVYDGPNSSYPLLLNHSGSTIPQPVVASSDSMLVTFKTDNSVSGWGFSASCILVTKLNVTIEAPRNKSTPATSQTTIADGCFAALHGSGNFSSPQFPSNYSANLDCYWRLESHTSFVNLQMLTFSTETNKDKVIVYEGWDTSGIVLALWSGFCESCTVRSSTKRMLIRFVTDSINNYGGFSAKFSSF